ncbi:hypothetical protein IJI31_04395 [bacterium]|nr:hypothetical protein [bacterium]
MQVSAISFKGVGISRNINFNGAKSENDRFIGKPIEKNTVLTFNEISDLYKFAKINKENVVLKVSYGPFMDSKSVKTQEDLIADKGQWLDITDYSCV